MLEFLAMEHVIDKETVINKERCRSGKQCVGTKSTQEFIFKKYLKSIGYYPDVIIVVANTHDLGVPRKEPGERTRENPQKPDQDHEE